MDTSTRQSLKAKAHHLKPVVMIGGKGLTAAVINEANVALTAHELIKVKIAGVEKEDKIALVKELCSHLEAELIQLIGNTAILFRESEN